jgi:serine/threonine protein kinase
MERYVKGEVLGEGTFGSVVKATVKEVRRLRSQCVHTSWNYTSVTRCEMWVMAPLLQTGQEVAIKKVRIAQAKEVRERLEAMILSFILP